MTEAGSVYRETGAPCIVCSAPLDARLTSNKAGRPSLMLVCREEPRHFRGFVNDQAYVRRVIERLEAGP